MAEQGFETQTSGSRVHVLTYYGRRAFKATIIVQNNKCINGASTGSYEGLLPSFVQQVSVKASHNRQWQSSILKNKRENIEWLEGLSKHGEQPLHIREGAKQIGGRAGLSKWPGTRVYGNGWEWPDEAGKLVSSRYQGPWVLCQGIL